MREEVGEVSLVLRDTRFARPQDEGDNSRVAIILAAAVAPSGRGRSLNPTEAAGR